MKSNRLSISIFLPTFAACRSLESATPWHGRYKVNNIPLSGSTCTTDATKASLIFTIYSFENKLKLGLNLVNILTEKVGVSNPNEHISEDMKRAYDELVVLKVGQIVERTPANIYW